VGRGKRLREKKEKITREEGKDYARKEKTSRVIFLPFAWGGPGESDEGDKGKGEWGGGEKGKVRAVCVYAVRLAAES